MTGCSAADRLRDRLVTLELLVFARRGRALHEEKLRAQQTDAFAAEFRDLAGVLESADVGDDLDAVPSLVAAGSSACARSSLRRSS